MAPIRFPYVQRRGNLEPIIPIGVKLGDRWERIEVYVDSGAAYSVFQASVARQVGFDFQTGRQVLLQVGSGTLIRIFLHDLEVQLGAERFIGQIGFSEQLGVKLNVLGKAGFFDRFRICFQEPQGFLTFEIFEPEL